MKINSVEYHNFMGFSETDNILDFENVFEDSDTVLVVGVRDGDPKHSNGSGKSTLIEGICYGFFGKLPRIVAERPNQKGEVAKEIIRTDEDDVFIAGESYIEIKFKTSDGRSWRLKRGRKVRKNRKSHTRILELDCDGEKIGGRKGADAEKQIEQILHFSFESLVNSCMFAQRDSGKFLNGTDTVRKDLFLELIGVSIIEQLLANVRRRKSSVNQEKLQVEATIGVLRERIELAGVEDPASQKSDWEKSISEFDGKIAVLEEEISNISDDKVREKYLDLSDKCTSINSSIRSQEIDTRAILVPINTRIGKHRIDIADADNEIKHIAEMKTRIQNEFNNALQKITPQKQLDEMRRLLDDAASELVTVSAENKELESRHAAMNNDIAVVLSDITRMESAVNSLNSFVNDGKKGEPCPTCGSDWDEETARAEIDRQEKLCAVQREKRDQLLLEIGLVVKAIDNKKVVINDLLSKTARESDYERAKSDSELATVRSEEIKVEAGALKEKEVAQQVIVVESTDLLAKAEQEFSAAETIENERAKKISDELSEAEELRDKAQAAFASLQEIQKAKTEVLTSTTKSRSDLQLKVAAIDAKIEVIQKDADAMHLATVNIADIEKRQKEILLLERVMSKDGFKTRVAEKFVPLLSRYANEFISLLSPDMSLDIKMDGSEIAIKVCGSNSSDYIMCSGGEKEVIRLAVNMANSMIAIGGNADLPGLVLLDEIFGSLDVMTRNNVFTLLDRLNEYFPRIIVITHDMGLQKGFSRRLVVAKEGRISKIAGVSTVA